MSEPRTVETNAYWRETRRPLTCLLFLAPLLAAYEIGVLWVGGDNSNAVRNGADLWIRAGLESVGGNQPWLLPAMVVVGLLVWHIAQGDRWCFPLSTMTGMAVECLVFAFLLVALGQLQGYALGNWGIGSRSATAIVSEREVAFAIVFVGAGIYEEVLFRLCLLPLCAGLFRVGGLTAGWGAVLAIFATSVAFSIAHHVGPAGEPFRLPIFWFRTIAGIFFAGLFVLRGFGITVGTHAAYDLIVGLLLRGAG